MVDIAQERRARRRRVLFSNNYDASSARRGVAEGVYPDHHLFGMGASPSDYSVVDLRSHSSSRWGMGDLAQQKEAVKRAPGTIFAANATPMRLVMLLRRLGLWRSPIVVVVHEVPGKGGSGLSRWIHSQVIKGADRIVSMCESTRAGLVELGVDPRRISVGPWGPDSRFAPFVRAPLSPRGPVVSLGKSNRDIDSAIKAISAVGHPGKVYVAQSAGLEPPQCVTLVASLPPPRRASESSSYEYVMADLASSSIVLIALRPGATALQGLTEMNDALACGKPVVVTRMPYFDLDIEAEGVGRWVAPGDWRAMARALEEILLDAVLYESMSARARELVRTRWNSANFTAHVWEVIRSVEAGPSGNSRA